MTYLNPLEVDAYIKPDSDRTGLSGAFRHAKRWLKQAWDGYVERRAQYRAIQALRQLDDHMLRDIGISHRSEIASTVVHGREGR